MHMDSSLKHVDDNVVTQSISQASHHHLSRLLTFYSYSQDKLYNWSITNSFEKGQVQKIHFKSHFKLTMRLSVRYVLLL